MKKEFLKRGRGGGAERKRDGERGGKRKEGWREG